MNMDQFNENNEFTRRYNNPKYRDVPKKHAPNT